MIQSLLGSYEHVGSRERQTIAHAVLEAERDHGVDALLLLAVMERESRFRPSARGPRGSIGLMQLRRPSSLARALDVDVDVERIEEPRANVRLAAAYLAALRDDFGRWDHALAAYNQGPTRVRRLLEERGRAPERYARAVIERWRALRAAAVQV